MQTFFSGKTAATQNQESASPKHRLPGDSSALKVFSYVPVVGHIVSIFGERAVDGALKVEQYAAKHCPQNSSKDRIIKLLQLKNQYHIAGMVRNSLSVVPFVALAAFRLMTGSIGTGLLAYTICDHALAIRINRNEIKQLQGNSVKSQKDRIPGNSTCLKVLSYIPLLGIFTSYYGEKLLNRELSEASSKGVSAERSIKLLQAKNHYNIAGMVRNILTVPLVITAISFRVISPFIGGVCVGYWGYRAVIRISEFDETSREIKRLKFGAKSNQLGKLLPA